MYAKIQENQPLVATLWSTEPPSDKTPRKIVLVTLLASPYVTLGHVLMHPSQLNTTFFSRVQVRMIMDPPLDIYLTDYSLTVFETALNSSSKGKIQQAFRDHCESVTEPFPVIDGTILCLKHNVYVMITCPTLRDAMLTPDSGKSPA